MKHAKTLQIIAASLLSGFLLWQTGICYAYDYIPASPVYLLYGANWVGFPLDYQINISPTPSFLVDVGNFKVYPILSYGSDYHLNIGPAIWQPNGSEFTFDDVISNALYNQPAGDFVAIAFYNVEQGCLFHWDLSKITLLTCIPPPATPTATISAPSNGASITDNSTTLSGSYTGLYQDDFGYYGSIKLWLENEVNHSHSSTYEVNPTSNNGSFSVPLSAFHVTENGTWDLQVQQDVFVNGSETQVPMLSAPYTLTFGVSGNSIPYTFTDWNTWYTANAAGGYTAPSDFANSIEGFFQPIFTNVYEFANQTLTYFNATTAYDKGNQIGLVFPTTQAYLDKIDVFFGGFPLIPFFEFLIIVMVGIFVIRTIFKFIPFFG